MKIKIFIKEKFNFFINSIFYHLIQLFILFNKEYILIILLVQYNN